MKRRLYIFLLFVVTSTQAQQYTFRHYQVEHGLSNNTIYCSVQDREGFLWFGTKDGLNRFDGYHFKVFKVPAKGYDMTSYFTSCLLIDEQDVMWVGCRNGLFIFDRRRECMVAVFDSLPEINAIQTDRSGNIWFISQSTLCRYTVRTKTLTTFPPSRYFNATTICTDSQNNLWVGTAGGFIQKFNATTETFTGFDLFSHSPHSPSHWIQKLFATSNHSLYVGTFNQGLKEFDYTTGTYTDVLTYNEDQTTLLIRDILQYTEHEFWFASETGIFILNTQTQQISHLTKKVPDPYSLSDNAVYSLCKDTEGGIWAGTYFGGINYYSKHYNAFHKFFPDNSPHTLSGSVVREICPDKDSNLWIGTEDAGLNKLHLPTGTITQFKPTGKAGSISYSNIHGLLVTENELWIGTFEHGLDIMDLKTGTVIRHYAKGQGEKDLKSNFIVSLLQTHTGDIYLGTSNGIYQFDRSTQGFDRVKGLPKNLFVSCMLEDASHVIWLGTHDRGVYYVNPQTNQIGHFENNPSRKNSLSSNTINAICEDAAHCLWFSTEGGGLCQLSAERTRFSTFTSQHGLPSNFVFKTLIDSRKNRWVSTSKGLATYHPNTRQWTTYTQENGLLTNQFNYNSGYIDKKGRMYFGSVKGLTVFAPAQLQKPSIVPHVFITGFQLQNKEIELTQDSSCLHESILYTRQINLPYDRSSFSIDFAALSYTAPEMTSYKYLMKGLDTEWTFLPHNRRIYFTNLKPGTYELFIQASNSNWKSKPISLTIHIESPFWKTWWAYSLYALIFTMLGWIFIQKYKKQQQDRQRQRYERLENEKAKEIYRSKIEFFTNVAHEIRTPLTLIKLPLEKIISTSSLSEDTKENLKIMEQNTNRLIDLTNQLLDFRKAENHGFSLCYVKTDVTELLEQLYNSFKPVAEEKLMHFTLETPRIHLQAYIDPEVVRKIVGNLVSNAIKYGVALAHIQILPFSSEDTFFSIRVSNDGYLIPPEMKEKIFEPFFRMKETEKEQGTGIGLALALSLAQLHKGTLAVETDPTRNSFLLNLPVHQAIGFELYEKLSDAPALLSEPPVSNASLTNKEVVLLVEDHQEILDFVGKELSSDYTILKAANGAEALHILQEAHVQLVVSDIMMPIMDGYSLCREIKSNVELSHIPIILLTAKNSLQARIEGLEMGADAYIEKPFSQPYLLAQIKNLLHNRNMMKEHFASSPLVNIKTMAYSKADEKFLISVNEVIQKNLANQNFTVDELAREMNMSRPTLYRKVRGLSNLSPNELITVTKLKKAAELLMEGNYKVYEVADKVGYSLATNFSRDFMKQFGISPSEYMHAKKKP